MSAIECALVYFTNGSEKIVSVQSIRNFHPRDKKHFQANRKYKVWWHGTKGEDDYLYNAYILLLGSNNSDIQKQRQEKRLKYPNKRNMSFSSNSTSRVRVKTKSKRIEKKQKLPTKAAQKEGYDIILRKHEKLMNSRKQLDADSSNDEGLEIIECNDPPPKGGNAEEQLVLDNTNESSKSCASEKDKEDSYSPGEEENQGTTTLLPSTSTLTNKTVRLNGEESDFDVSGGMCGHSSVYSPSPTSSSPKCLGRFAPNGRFPAREQSCNPGPSNMSGRRLSVPPSSNSSILTPFEESAQNRRFSAPDQSTINLLQRSTSGPRQRTTAPIERSERIANKNAEYERFARNDEERVHLGENIYVHPDVWENMKRKNDSKFVRELAELMWGRVALQKRCVDPTKLRKQKENNCPEEEIRKELTPSKCKLIEELLYEKITAAGVVGAQRFTRVKKMWLYLSKKVADVRRKLSFK